MKTIISTTLTFALLLGVAQAQSPVGTSDLACLACSRRQARGAGRRRRDDRGLPPVRR